jgi:hypothetical protein
VVVVDGGLVVAEGVERVAVIFGVRYFQKRYEPVDLDLQTRLLACTIVGAH